jgi:hypothetical protein
VGSIWGKSGPPTFISSLDFPQVAESRCGCAGSNKPISRRTRFRQEEQLLEPLSLVEGSLHPEVGGTRQEAFCKRQDAFHVEFFELTAGGGRSARA